MTEGRRAFKGPSTSAADRLKWFTSPFHSGCLASTLGLPTITMPNRARVSATLSRRVSLRKPMPIESLERTQERMM